MRTLECAFETEHSEVFSALSFLLLVSGMFCRKVRATVLYKFYLFYLILAINFFQGDVG